MLCLTLTEPTVEQFCSKIQTIPSHLKAVECRFDLMHAVDTSCVDQVGRCLRAEKPDIVSIATIRRPQDGGTWAGSEADRLDLLAYCWASQLFTYVDVEEDQYQRFVEKGQKNPIESTEGHQRESKKTKILCSYHNCDAIPTDILKTVKAMLAYGVPVKVSLMIRNTAEQLKLVILANYLKRHSAQGFILIGMGEYGEWSRILYRQLGAFLTFVHDAESPAAGMLHHKIIHTLYRVSLLEEDVLIFGIIGNPIRQTRSPQFHNDVFASVGAHAVYVPFLVDDCSIFLHMAKQLGIRGFSVTVPFKQKIVSELDQRDRVVQACGAANTVVLENDGYSGYNTDYTGFLQPLRLALESRSLDGSRELKAAVLGAGGASASIVAALLALHFHVTVFNRTLQKAKLIAERYPNTVVAAPLEASLSDRFDCIVQCTTLGMYPQEKESPIPEYRFRGDEIVYDIIHKPRKTAFLIRAEEAGCVCIDGMAMFEKQAEDQAILFKRIVTQTIDRA